MAIDDRSRRQVLLQLGTWLGVALVAGCDARTSSFEVAPATEPMLRVVSFNVQYLDLTTNGVASTRSLRNWEKRRGAVLAVLQQIRPDIIAFQEMESWTGEPQMGPPVQRTWLSEQMQDFRVAAHTCAIGRESSQPVFFRNDRFELLDDGTELLDPMSDFGEAFAGYADLVSWARLRDRITGKNLTIVNLHLHFSNQLRQHGGAQVAAQIAQMAMARGDRVVVLGDMNVGVWSRPMALLRSSELIHVPAEGASFHFNLGLLAFDAIDHILHGPNFAAAGPASIMRGQIEGVWPSDHYPIWADLHPL